MTAIHDKHRENVATMKRIYTQSLKNERALYTAALDEVRAALAAELEHRTSDARAEILRATVEALAPLVPEGYTVECDPLPDVRSAGEDKMPIGGWPYWRNR